MDVVHCWSCLQCSSLMLISMDTPISVYLLAVCIWIVPTCILTLYVTYRRVRPDCLDQKEWRWALQWSAHGSVAVIIGLAIGYLPNMGISYWLCHTMCMGNQELRKLPVWLWKYALKDLAKLYQIGYRYWQIFVIHYVLSAKFHISTSPVCVVMFVCVCLQASVRECLLHDILPYVFLYIGSTRPQGRERQDWYDWWLWTNCKWKKNQLSETEFDIVNKTFHGLPVSAGSPWSNGSNWTSGSSRESWTSRRYGESAKSVKQIHSAIAISCLPFVPIVCRVPLVPLALPEWTVCLGCRGRKELR